MTSGAKLILFHRTPIQTMYLQTNIQWVSWINLLIHQENKDQYSRTLVKCAETYWTGDVVFLSSQILTSPPWVVAKRWREILFHLTWAAAARNTQNINNSATGYSIFYQLDIRTKWWQGDSWLFRFSYIPDECESI